MSKSDFLKSAGIFVMGVATGLLINFVRSQKRIEKPQLRILLIRHGESEANVDKSVYTRIPDHDIPLTNKGVLMAKEAGKQAKEYLMRINKECKGRQKVKMYVSPFRRTRETASEIADACGDLISKICEDPFLVEQDWGLYEGNGIEHAQKEHPEEYNRMEIAKKHRGCFWVRFPNGESTFDVCIRIKGFIGSLMRSRHRVHKGKDGFLNFIIVTHGITARAFIMTYFSYNYEWYDASTNHPNCSIYLIDGNNDAGFIFPGYGRDGSLLQLNELIQKQ